MPPRRRIHPEQGRDALAAWRADPEAGRTVVATAVRYTLESLAAASPGRSVEVRVPPYGAVQCVPGPTHTRGTPANVIELDAATWLALATGSLTWAQALESGAVSASGGRADLSGLLPLRETSAPPCVG